MRVWCRSRALRGFSLAELLVCLMIIALLAALLVPAALGAWRAAQALKRQVEGG
jgi:prepilin-type N-terminal cleavage/methylation domain-containing protein